MWFHPFHTFPLFQEWWSKWSELISLQMATVLEKRWNQREREREGGAEKREELAYFFETLFRWEEPRDQHTCRPWMADWWGSKHLADGQKRIKMAEEPGPTSWIIVFSSTSGESERARSSVEVTSQDLLHVPLTSVSSPGPKAATAQQHWRGPGQSNDGIHTVLACCQAKTQKIEVKRTKLKQHWGSTCAPPPPSPTFSPSLPLVHPVTVFQQEMLLHSHAGLQPG